MNAAAGQVDDFTASHLLDYSCFFIKQDKFIAIDLTKLSVFDVNTKNYSKFILKVIMAYLRYTALIRAYFEKNRRPTDSVF